MMSLLQTNRSRSNFAFCFEDDTDILSLDDRVIMIGHQVNHDTRLLEIFESLTVLQILYEETVANLNSRDDSTSQQQQNIIPKIGERNLAGI